MLTIYLLNTPLANRGTCITNYHKKSFDILRLLLRCVRSNYSPCRSAAHVSMCLTWHVPWLLPLRCPICCWEVMKLPLHLFSVRPPFLVLRLNNRVCHSLQEALARENYIPFPWSLLISKHVGCLSGQAFSFCYFLFSRHSCYLMHLIF